MLILSSLLKTFTLILDFSNLDKASLRHIKDQAILDPVFWKETKNHQILCDQFHGSFSNRARARRKTCARASNQLISNTVKKKKYESNLEKRKLIQKFYLDLRFFELG